MNRIGINYLQELGTPDACFSLFRALGFDAVFTDTCFDEERMKQVADAARKNGLYYECQHAPFRKINDIWKPGEAGDAMLKSLTDSVDICARYGVPKLVVHLSSGEKAPCVNDLGHARFDTLVAEAVKKNVTLCFENQRKLANIAFVFELYDEVEQVRFCFDVGHESCFTPGREYLPLFGKKLVYTHIHDNDRVYNGDLHMIPYDGKIDYDRVISQLAALDYRETLTLEIIPGCSGRYTDVDTVAYYTRARRAVERFKAALVKEKARIGIKN